MRIEVVCHANICRSPVAAALLRQGTGVHVTSSGLRATPGQPVDRRMLALIGKELPCVLEHRSSRFDPGNRPHADVILVMEHVQKLQIVNLLPQLAGRTMMFGRWLEGAADIVDPFGLSDREYALTIARLRMAATAWVERLSGILKT